jgi:hypothetical protein
LKYKKEWGFRIKLCKNEKGFHQIESVLKNKKSIINNNILPNSLIWKKISKKWNVSPLTLYNNFKKLKEGLLFLKTH